MENKLWASSPFDELIAHNFPSLCAMDTIFQGTVIVIGAGAAGLSAGYLLHKKGIQCLILEASSRYGGRLKKLDGFADFPIDTGAEWLHDKKSIIGELVTKTRTEIYADHCKVLYWFDNQFRENLPNQDIQMLARIKDVPDISIKDYARQQQWDIAYDAYLDCLAGDIGGSAENVSAYWALQQYADPDNTHVDYRFHKTYFDFINENLVLPIRDLIQLNTQVIQIDYRRDKIIVTDNNNHTYQADKVILTVPITILKDNDICFIPSLPREKIQAFHSIGMEPGMKVFMKFSTKFYKSSFITGCPVANTYYDETYGKQTNENILQAFIIGKNAEKLTALGDHQAIVNAILEELDTMYDKQARTTFLSAHVENWTTEPFIRGAYSYPKVNCNNDARQLAAQHVNKKLFFAGEAMNTNLRTHTVHGAVETGILAVIDILNSCK